MILWDHPATVVLKHLPLRTAEQIDAAIIRLHETGEGTVNWQAPYCILRAGKYDVVLVIEPDAETIAVLQIYRARP